MSKDSLTRDEIEALRRMPEFERALRQVRAIRERETREKAEAKAKVERYCEGAVPIRRVKGFECPKCGLFVEYGYNGQPNENADRTHDILMRDEHWNRPDQPDANPFTKSGLYGKAAAAADGDWYGSH